MDRRRDYGERTHFFDAEAWCRAAAARRRNPCEDRAQRSANHRPQDELVDFIISGPVAAMVVEADGAISILRKICGATKADEALPGTIRGDFAEHTNLNIIHASDSVESARREIALFFKPEEIFEWKDGNDDWI
jgi:nucleoside diphosphate kinase